MHHSIAALALTTVSARVSQGSTDGDENLPLVVLSIQSGQDGAVFGRQRPTARRSACLAGPRRCGVESMPAGGSEPERLQDLL